MSAQITFYEELELPRDAELAAIVKAYKKKALEWHPDKHPEEEKEEWTLKFQHLQEILETLGNEQSRRIYDEKNIRAERTRRVLVLMDMNGSLLCKVDKRECSPSKRAQADFEDKHNYFFLRPYVKEFLDAMLSQDSNIAFAIYTSRQQQNAIPQVQNLFSSAGCSPRALFNIFAGDTFSVPDPEQGPYKSKRSLPKIWRDRTTCAAPGVKFDECTTVNLDNEASKLRDHPWNGLVVPSYSEASIGKKDEVLLSLKEYLLRLAKESHGDVREYMKLFPFSLSGQVQSRALPPVSEFLVEDADADPKVEELAAKVAGFSLSSSD